MLKINELRQIHLGIQGENLARQIPIDVSEWLINYPNGSISIWHKRNGDSNPGPTGATLDREKGILTWTPTNTDTYYDGEGSAEVRLSEDGVIKKTREIKTDVSPAVTLAGTTLGSDWQSYIDAVEELKDAAAGYAEDAAEAAEEAVEGMIDDTAGAGDTDKVWSADKLTDELAGKTDEPETEGTDGQVLATDGSGGRYWKTVESGSGGTSDYSDLTNKPKIGGVTLTGNKSLADLGAASASDVSAKYTKPASGIPASDLASGVIPDVSGFYTKPSGGIPSTDLADTFIEEPANDGTSGQVLTTDGNGGRSWTTVQGGGTEHGVPSGGSTNQVLAKNSNTDYDLKWVNQSGGGSGDATIHDSTATGIDLDVSDSSGNVVMRLKNGHIQTKHFNSADAGNAICYVSPNGSDSNNGDSSHPFLTIQHAIDNGFNRIMLAPGEYKNQKVTINGKHGISIVCNTNTYESNLFESHQRQARAKLDNSIDVTGLTASDSIYRTALSVSTDSSYYKVFVSKTVDPVYSGSDYFGRVTTYNAILWEITDSILTCTRLVPKLTLSECQQTAGTFFYDGTYLYVHPTNGSLSGVSYKRLNDDTFASVTNGFYIYNSTDINIEGLDVQFFPYYGFHANLTSGLTMRDCGFYFTCYGSACEFHTSNADLWECTAAQAGADGFGIAAGGNVSVYNCNAVYCYDDGISYHDESTGIIDGGFWKYCKKGGVTPSYGSNVTVKNVISTNNVYGIYITQSGTRITNRAQYIQNCLAVDNTTKDIKVTGYNVIAHGCSYADKEVDTGASLVEYNCTVIS